MEEDNTTKTKERIIEHFGCYEDIIHTSFSIQHDNSCFIDASNIKRKDELERIMRFEIVKKLYEIVNQTINKDKAIYEHIKKKIKNDEIVSIKKAKNDAEQKIKIITINKESTKNKIKKLHNEILETTTKLHPNWIENYNNFINTYDIQNITQTNSTINNSIIENTNKLKQLETKLLNICSNDTILPDNLIYLRTLLTTQITEYNKNINDNNINIKETDKTIEQLYKSKTPCYIKINSDISSSFTYIQHKEYLINEEQEYNTKITDTLSEINKLTNNLEQLSINEHIIEKNNEQILNLEKQLIKMPAELLTKINNLPNLETNYNMLLHKFIVDILNNTSNDVIINIDNIQDLQSYKNYIKHAGDYFLAKELFLFKPIVNQQILLEDQHKLEETNMKLKLDINEKKILLKQLKVLDNNIIQFQTKINLIKTDLDNLKNNYVLDEQIEQHKIYRIEFETQNTNINEQLCKNNLYISNINEYESILLLQDSLHLRLNQNQNIIDQFELYSSQKTEYKPTLDILEKLNDELSDAEQSIILIEEQYTFEHANIIKYNALLEQIKRDLQEGREIERRLHINELYRDALKQLPYILLRTIQPILEKKVNDLLTIITDFTIKFDMSDNKIDIYLDRTIYKDKTRNIIINNASGFERFIASLAIRIALLELSNLPKINFMAIDEGWSSFDTHNINNVSIILEYLTHKFDFILTISHLIQIKEHCDIQLSLQKDIQGFSVITY